MVMRTMVGDELRESEDIWSIVSFMLEA